MKILFLCNKSPYPPKEGGPIAMNMIVEGLIHAGHQVKVLAINSNKYYINPDDIPETYRKQTGLELVDVDLSVRPLKAFLNLFSGKSFHVERFKSAKFRERLTGILKNEEFDVVQFEMLYMSAYLDTVKKHSGAVTILRCHNIEHLIWERIAENTSNPMRRMYVKHLSRKLKKYELSVVSRFDGIAAITRNDAEFFRMHTRVSKDRITDITFGIEIEKFGAVKETFEFPSLFSIGSMNWIPNQEGIRWFLNNVWPDIHSSFPDLTYYIAGRAMPGWLVESRIPNVKVVGEVEDALEFMLSKGVLIVPLFSGSGIRIKIIEAMAAGKAIISTTIGAEGINYTPGENILIADSPCEFFEMVSVSLNDIEFCRRLGSNARNLVITEHSTDQVIRKLEAFYQKSGA
jgi:polysaccharide biosynthesis protein PslH